MAVHPVRAFFVKLLMWLLNKCVLAVSIVEGVIHIQLSIGGVVVIDYHLPIPVPEQKQTAQPRRVRG